jgi:hypothetical protein
LDGPHGRGFFLHIFSVMETGTFNKAEPLNQELKRRTLAFMERRGMRSDRFADSALSDLH